MGADLSHAVLSNAQLIGTDLSDSLLNGAKLGAFMPRAVLTGASLEGADLSDAMMASVRGLTQPQLDRACGNGKTALPAGLTVRPC